MNLQQIMIDGTRVDDRECKYILELVLGARQEQTMTAVRVCQQPCLCFFARDVPMVIAAHANLLRRLHRRHATSACMG